MTMSEKEDAKLYKKCGDVDMKECHVGGKWCATCAYMRDHDSNFHYYEHMYCMCAKKAGAEHEN